MGRGISPERLFVELGATAQHFLVVGRLLALAAEHVQPAAVRRGAAAAQRLGHGRDGLPLVGVLAVLVAARRVAVAVAAAHRVDAVVDLHEAEPVYIIVL